MIRMKGGAASKKEDEGKYSKLTIYYGMADYPILITILSPKALKALYAVQSVSREKIHS